MQNALTKKIRAYSITRRCFKPGFLLKNEFIGEVKGDRFWLHKTKPRVHHRGMSRIYKGTIFKANGKTVIEGKFCYPTCLLVIALIIILLITIASTPQFLYAIKEGINIRIILKYVIFLIVPAGVIFMAVYSHASNFIDEENEVIELLHRLFDSSE